jgi:hypothetical protein
MNVKQLDSEYKSAYKFLLKRISPEISIKLNKGDFAENLLSYLRNRKKPKLPFSPDNLVNIGRLTGKYDSDEASWNKKIADQALKGKLYAASNAYCDRFLSVNKKTFDFSEYKHNDPETIHALNRQRVTEALAKEYWAQNKNPKYFNCLMEQWDFFVSKVPMPGEQLFKKLDVFGKNTRKGPPYHTLDNYVRLTNWWWAFWLSLYAEQMTGKRCVILLARCLKLFDLVATFGIRNHEHNFTAMQMESLYIWSIMLPEISGMRIWKYFVRNTDQAAISKAVFPDGVQYEKSAGYHGGCITWYGFPYLMGKINNEPWPAEYGAILKKMAKYLDAIITPENKLPLLSDSDQTGAWRNALAFVKSVFPNIRFQHSVTPTYGSLWRAGGKEWKEPKPQIKVPQTKIFNQAGVAVARNQPGSMLILDNGPNDAWHSHMDNMTVHYYAFNKSCLVDPGRAIYKKDNTRRWVMSAESHNTIIAEENKQTPFLKSLTLGNTDIGPLSFRRSKETITLKKWFKGFNIDDSAVVQRKAIVPTTGSETWLVIVDKISSVKTHKWTNSFLIPSEKKLQDFKYGYTSKLDTGITLNFSFASNQKLNIRNQKKFWFPEYAQKKPAQWIRFSSNCSSATRIFAFMPTKQKREMPRIQMSEHKASIKIAQTVLNINI